MPKYSLALLFLWFLATEGVAHGTQKENPASAPSKPYENSHFVMVDSCTLHYRIWNENLARPIGKVVLVHGFTGSTFCWRKNIEPLVNAGFRVVAVDLPSFGYSERNPNLNQSNSNRAHLLWLLLKELDGPDTSPWNVVGHSMGGGIAEAMGILEPGRTRTLTIAAGMIFIKSNNLTNTISAIGNNRIVKNILVELAEKNVVTYNTMRKLLKSAYGRDPDSTEVMGYLTPLLIDGTVEAGFGIWTHSREMIKMEVETLRNTPVLILWGTKDKWIGKAKGKRLQQAVPHSEMKIIPGAGHILMETHPDEFNALFVPWLIKHNP